MTVESIACAVCGEEVYLSGKHVRLNAEFKSMARREKQFVAHVECVDGFVEPAP